MIGGAGSPLDGRDARYDMSPDDRCNHPRPPCAMSVTNGMQHAAERSGTPVPVVVERIRAMLEAGAIRRGRQMLMTTSLADGA